MSNTLRASALATLSTLFSFGSPAGSFADARTDWDNYAWQTIPISQCQAQETTLVCPPYHQRWDWKRNQWVDIAVTLDTSTGTVALSQTLTDNDKADSDYVCVTALILDGDGQNLVAHHTNWHMFPRRPQSEAFSYHSSRLASAASIQIGSKQCRQGATQDDDLYRAVLAGIAP